MTVMTAIVTYGRVKFVKVLQIQFILVIYFIIAATATEQQLYPYLCLNHCL